ncbi:MAG: dTDP-4-dehydrorhamnose reductase [Patescibacteria group bacterium]
MKKVLIIGAAGMLGQYLAKIFTNEDLYLVDRDKLDIINPAAVLKLVRDLKPQVIINAAAYNAVDLAETDFVTAQQVNGYAVGSLAKAAKEVDAILIHYSTDYVFDGEKEEGYVETDLPNPISRYGQSKYLGEQELQENCDKYYLIRLSRLFGRVGDGVGVKESFVDKILKLTQNKSELEIIDEEVSSPTYAADLAEFTLALLVKGEPFGIYHGANSGSCTWFGLAQEVAKIRGIDIRLIPVSGAKLARTAKRPRYSILLNTKFIPMRSWHEALAEYLNHV